MGHLHRLYTRHAAEVWRRESELLAAQGLVRPPVAVQWIVTSACDLSCPHCYSGAGRRHPSELGTAEAKRTIIDELAAMAAIDEEGRATAPTLVLAGGELLLRHDIAKLVTYATERGVPWAMHTHGAHVPRHREWLARMPPKLAAISLDGEADIHDAFRGKHGSHAAALEAVRLLRDLGCDEVVIGTTVTRHNADHLADLFPIVRRSGAHSWGLHLFAPEGRGAEHAALFPDDDQLRRVVAFAKRARQLFHVELCNEWGGAGEDDLYVRDDPFACGAGRISCVIGAGGELLPCTTTDLRESEGNVREVSFRELWLRGFGRFRRHGSDPCGDDQECWLQSRNGNACRHRAFGERSVVEAPSEPSLEPATLVRLRSVSSPAARAQPRLGSARALASARAMALASLVASGCTSRAPTVETPETSVAPPPADRTSARNEGGASFALPDETARALAAWPEQLDEAGLTRRYEQAQLGSEAHFAKRAPDDRSIVALDDHLHAIEQTAMFHADVIAQIWRELGRRLTDGGPLDVSERHALVRLTARLRRHARVVDTLVRAEAETGPVEFLAWRSKAAPPPGHRNGVKLPEGLLEAAREHWPQAGAGSWEREACIEVELRRGVAWRIRGGAAEPLVVNDPMQLCRLDLIVVTAGSEVADCCLGRLELAPDVPTSLWEIETLLSPTARTEIELLVRRAVEGDEAALRPLAEQLAQSQATIRRALHDQGNAVGASALRQLLWLWDR